MDNLPVSVLAEIDGAITDLDNGKGISHDEVMKKIQQTVYKIVWSDFGITTYINCIEYLEKEWTVRKISNFIAVRKKILMLTFQPRIGALTDKRKNIRTKKCPAYLPA